ncbi:M99 family carboxypeptidase catalytic domain-containing protein [Helicobacter mesocricetorum]|uniref:M99 family carboxypeptidase catalytic domain-containing protein n=1 Tax=Helicobacter mesocricetorum TaxID=87012 RepID=UPI000CF0B6EB|nr:M99 family carboxypeptidase catalytic domain-containing protein [Helicobacter mesocricetorum]
MRITKIFLWIIALGVMLLAKNSPFAFYALNGEQEGHTLLVIGGIHGDEPGGYFAPAILAQYYTIKKGNVLIVPNLNPDSIMTFKRGIYKDMNRKFAHISQKDPDFDNVTRIKEIIKDSKVDFIVNLHDGRGFYRQEWENSIFNPKAWGQTYVIDQKTLDDVPFGDLDNITQQIETKLNQSLHYDFHTFGVRNTQTRFNDEEQQNSLTFFAITNLKPAIAIETSKNIKELDLKTFYQLSSIEALMDIMGIEYERSFEMNLKEVDKKVKEYGKLSINDNMALELENIQSILNFVPLKKEENRFIFTHPLGRIHQGKNGYEVFIGHKRIALLKPDYFSMECDIQDMNISLDKRAFEAVRFGTIVEAKEQFLVEGREGVRVNVIGYAKKGVISEDNMQIKMDWIDGNYSLDKDKMVFRLEVYKDNNFCGMINIKKGN